MENLKIWITRTLAIIICVIFLMPIVTAMGEVLTEGQSLSDAKFRYQKISTSKLRWGQKQTQLQDRLRQRLSDQKFLPQSDGQAQATFQAQLSSLIKASGGRLENIQIKQPQNETDDKTLNTMRAEIRWSGSEAQWHALLKLISKSPSNAQIDTFSIQRRGASERPLLIRMNVSALKLSKAIDET